MRLSGLTAKVILFIFLFIVSCSNNQICAPGKQGECSCENGKNGVRSCKLDGREWNSCSCDSTPDGGTNTPDSKSTDFTQKSKVLNINPSVIRVSVNGTATATAFFTKPTTEEAILTIVFSTPGIAKLSGNKTEILVPAGESSVEISITGVSSGTTKLSVSNDKQPPVTASIIVSG